MYENILIMQPTKILYYKKKTKLIIQQNIIKNE